MAGINSYSDGLNDDQIAALDSSDRIIVVPACPGSGKTRLFVATVTQQILARQGGVAAISFTNVAEQEVRRRLHSLTGGVTHPHFIGTIDGFLLRYVVKPFAGAWVGMSKFSHPIDDQDTFGQVEALSERLRGKRVKDVTLRLCDGKTLLFLDGEQLTDKETIGRVFKEKKKAWKDGILTYDDVCYLAVCLLTKDEIRKIVLSRFPILLIDEFQDTGGSREDALLYLLGDERLRRGLVVGDPDQCIMQFSDARPDLFDDILRLNGAQKFPLKRSYRYHAGIASVTCHLSNQFKKLDCEPAPECEKASTVLLFHDYGNQERDLSAVCQAFSLFLQEHDLSECQIPPAILSWRRNTVDRLRKAGSTRLQFECRWLQNLYGAIEFFYTGDVASAFKKAERVLSDACGMGGSLATTLMLKDKGLVRQQWKRAVWSLLQKSLPASNSETVRQWVARLKEDIKNPFENVGGDISLIRHKIKFNKDSLGRHCDSVFMQVLIPADDTSDTTFTIDNVHQVKGKEFPAVCYFVPKQKANEPGAIESWFGRWEHESARVAYVAFTRAQKALMLIIPRNWLEELQKCEAGQAFINSFEKATELSDFLVEPKVEAMTSSISVDSALQTT